MKRIPLTQSKFALVDDADYDSLRQYRWLTEKGRFTCYAARYSHRFAGKNISVKMHRQILGLSRGDKRQCDHRDHNGLNNQRSNLRICTHQENQHNQRRQTRRKSSRFKGVCRVRRRHKWQAQIKYDNRDIYLGYFSDEIDAAKAYDDAARQYFGEFARPNFREG